MKDVIEKSCSQCERCFNHDIQLAVTDSRRLYHFSMLSPGTEFWITLEVIQKGDLITLRFPLLNFGVPYDIPAYIATASGFLPEEIWPSDIVYRSVLVPSLSGLVTFNTPLPGYIISISAAGEIYIYGSGQPSNQIPPGPQVLPPTDITYTIKPVSTLKCNTKLSLGPSNVIGFVSLPYPIPNANIAYRDSHVNDAYDGVIAYAWTDNFTEVDKSNGVMNTMVAIGHRTKSGKVKMNKAQQLTNWTSPTLSWDTAISINRINPQLIVVSYAALNYATGDPFTAYFQTSTDGGRNWSPPTPLPLGPPGPTNPDYYVSDNRGVSCDNYGNFWYSTTHAFNASFEEINQPFFMLSTDGFNWQTVYTFPDPTTIAGPNSLWDYPQFCFGTDGAGDYGMYFNADFLPGTGGFPYVGFIPITGPGVSGVGTGYATFLTQLEDLVALGSMTATLDGRVWILYANYGSSWTYLQTPFSNMYKSPTGTTGPDSLALNWMGPWPFSMTSWLYNGSGTPPNSKSYPFSGFILNSIQSNIFDNKRQALYNIISSPYPDLSQNMRISFAISRNNGQSWSDPIEISNSNFANRGFQSMALDVKTGDLYFGWYDGRNDPTMESLEYYMAYIPAKCLDELVASIPVSNPQYSTPSIA